jgi:hypothetical protein
MSKKRLLYRLSGLYGWYRMRQASKVDWTQEWETFLEANPGVEEGNRRIFILTKTKCIQIETFKYI